MVKSKDGKPSPKEFDWIEPFFANYFDTGSIRKSMALAGRHQTGFYKLYHANQKFKDRFEAYRNRYIKRSGLELEQSAIDKAINGWEEPIFYKGEMCGTKRKFSEALIIFLLKCLIPDRYNIENVVRPEDAGKVAENIRMNLKQMKETVPDAI